MTLRITTLALATAMAFSTALLAQDKAHSDKERQEDAARHRHLATVHAAAAKCLESGRSEKECHEQLRKDCKGVGIGRYCGMRHKH
ncbi:MAG TPA: hypothetical protein VM489_07820 [Burkholderiales bacterium]|nr:hypothetical protein [Burkholderiales bacterium]